MNCLRALRLVLVLAPAWSGCVGPNAPADPFPKTTPNRAEGPALPPFPGEANAPAKSHSAAYADGYRAGVLAHLDGTSRPPAPPLTHRLANYWDVGNPSAEDWSDGFRTGSAAARRSGLRGPNASPQPPASVAQHAATAPNAGGFRPVARAPSLPLSTPPLGAVAAVAPVPATLPAPVPAPVAPSVVPAAAPPRAPDRQPILAIERTVTADPAPAVPAAVPPPGPEFEPWKAARLHAPSVVRDP